MKKASTKITNINPAVLTWARKRAGLDIESLARRFPKLTAWETGEAHPTLRQLENFANAVHVAIGFLFLSNPPEESLPITDCRTFGDTAPSFFSPDLLDTIYLCQQRQSWYSEYVQKTDNTTCEFVGSVTLEDDPALVAQTIRNTLTLSLEEQQRLHNWEDTLRHFINQPR